MANAAEKPGEHQVDAGQQVGPPPDDDGDYAKAGMVKSNGDGGAGSVTVWENSNPAAFECRFPQHIRKPTKWYSVNPVAAPIELSSYDDARKSPEATHWLQAMEDELGSLHAQGT